MTTSRIGRDYLKSGDWDAWRESPTDQKDGVPHPPLHKPATPGARIVDLVPTDQITVGQMPLLDVLRKRRSRRKYTPEALTLEELSFLLWSTQGIDKVIREGQLGLRPAPSAGGRHPFETYILVNNVKGLEPGLYRYLPLDHKLCLESQAPDLAQHIHAATRDQYVLNSAVTFVWTVIPYRSEWRYTDRSYKVIAIDIGHVCQNLYLAAESIGAGTCAIGAYNQGQSDAAIGVDGEDEFTVYIAPVGKLPG